MEKIKMTKIYKMYDMQDENDSWETSLEDAQQWLIRFWIENNDCQLTDEELNGFIEKIEESDADELDDYLQGIDYAIEEIERSECR